MDDSVINLSSLAINSGGRIDLSIGTSAAQTATSLNFGIYSLWTTVDCYVRIAPTANDVTVAASGGKGGYLLKATEKLPFFVQQGENIGAITASGSGTLSIFKVSR